MTRSTLICLATVLAALSGCDGEKDAPATSGAKATPTKAASSDWLLKARPDEALPVREAKSDAEAGAEIAVVGRIGGRKEPLTPDSPVFVIVDMEVLHCGQMGEKGHCPTPWDYCCEPPESLTASSATVQLVDDAGAALSVDPASAGLKPLDEVVVVGTVGPRPNKDVLTIRATGVYRVSGG